MFKQSEVVENYIVTANGKANGVWYKLLVLAVLAGAFIAFGAAAATFSGVYSGSNVVKAAVFPVGLILVVVCGAELFTGNCLMFAPLVKRDVKIKGVFKNLGIVYLGNLVGGVIIAVLVVYSKAMPESVAAAAVATAAAKSSMNIGECLLRGVLCNMLVCLAVWAAMSAKSAAGKIAALYLPVFAFVVCGFEHSIANAYYLSAGLMASSYYGLAATGLTVGGAALSMLFSTLGNIIGGAAVAFALYLPARKKEIAQHPETTATEES